VYREECWLPLRPGRKSSQEKELSDFGRWIEALCAIYNISSDTKLAELAGLHQTTVTTAKYEPKVPDPETVEKLWKAFNSFGNGDGIIPPTMEEGFYAHGHHTTQWQKECARQQLEAVEQVAQICKRLMEQNSEIERLHMDIEQLQSQAERQKSRALENIRAEVTRLQVRLQEQQQRSQERIRQLQQQLRQQEKEIQRLRKQQEERHS
jgi:hypothetical protein